jgi:hypothetical protein
MKRLLPTLLVLTASATAAAPALAADNPTGMREVCAKSTYVRHTPNLTMIGTLFKHQKIKVTRYDTSHKHAYGFAYGHVQKNGWVKTADLCD